jgi:NAD(P)H-flavin reductase
MLDTLRARDQQRDIVLLHGASYDHDLAWRDELEPMAANGEFPIRYLPTVSRPQQCPGWTGLTGRVETVVPGELDELGLNPETATLYLCGNPDMITAVEEIGTERGFPPEQIRKELYWPKGRTH